MFSNRLRKNLRHLARWARREQISSFRVYDRDIPEFNVAVDLYTGAERWVHLQEYAPPAEISPARAAERLAQCHAGVREVFEVPDENIFVKVRRRQRGAQQYERQDQSGRTMVVDEGGLSFEVNLSDYLDTGLFLDHRPLRKRMRMEAAGCDLLNLFAYTGTFSAHAAAGGARSTTSVDLSRTYLQWAQRNFALNGLAAHCVDGEDAAAEGSGRRQVRPLPGNRLVLADCLAWLDRALEAAPRWTLIVVDPPTFSTSKRMRETFDVVRDHVTLLNKASQLLAAGGVLYFSTNHRRFRLDPGAMPDLDVEEITSETIPRDFARGAPIHRAWRARRA